MTGNPPAPALLAHTHQTAPPDNPSASTKTVVPLHVPGLLDLGVSTATSQARWASDTDCLPSGASIERSGVSTADAELLGVAGLNAGLLKLTNTVATAQSTRLQRTAIGEPRAVISNAAGSAADLKLLGGSVHVQVASAPVLTATASGRAGGAHVTWQAPLVTVNGKPLSVANSPLDIVSPDNPLLHLELSLGRQTNVVESQDGTHASADASVLHLQLKLAGLTVVEADLFPLSVSATAPAGGVVCPIDSLTDTDGDGLPDVDEVSGDKNQYDGQPTNPNDPDSDGDGLNDLQEVTGSENSHYGNAPTNPNNPDTDGDGLTDKQETDGFDVPGAGKVYTDPNKADTDGDTLGDKAEFDGTSNAYDGKPTNPVSDDTDGDGLKDNAENTGFAGKATNPNVADTDGDGLTDGQEVSGSENDAFGNTPTDPNKADSDGDGLQDGQEIPAQSPTSQNIAFNKEATNPNNPDTDGDGLTDLQEETGSANSAFGGKATNPNVADTDKDGLTDGQETSGSKNVKFGNKPTNPLVSDTDGDGLLDGEETTGVHNAKFNHEPTDPNVADTDKGGVPDGTEELTAGTNPNDPSDDKLVPFAFNRVAGTDRYETSARIALRFGPSEEAILANGQSTGYADALTGTYFAGTRDVPMLLTRHDTAPATTLDALNKLGVKRIYVMGGQAAISSAQVDNLRSRGYEVVRISGVNRYETNAAVISAAGDSSSDTAIVATGQDFPDALASGPLAYNEGMPLALTKANDMPDDVVKALIVARVQHVIIVGGDSAVSPAVATELNDAGISVTRRIAGTDRSQTARLIATYAVNNLNFSKTAVDVASGAQAGTGADALSGSSLAGKLDRPLLITASASNPGESTVYLKDHAATLITGTIFGGTGAVTAGAENQMTQAVNNNRPKTP